MATIGRFFGRSLLVGALLVCAAISLAACGGDSESSTKDMNAQELLSKVKLGMPEKQVTDELGEPSGSFATQTGATAKFIEYDSKDGVVAITIDRGVVASTRALGPDDTEMPGEAAGEQGAEDVPRQFGN